MPAVSRDDVEDDDLCVGGYEDGAYAWGDQMRPHRRLYGFARLPRVSAPGVMTLRMERLCAKVPHGAGNQTATTCLPHLRILLGIDYGFVS